MANETNIDRLEFEPEHSNFLDDSISNFSSNESIDLGFDGEEDSNFSLSLSKVTPLTKNKYKAGQDAYVWELQDGYVSNTGKILKKSTVIVADVIKPYTDVKRKNTWFKLDGENSYISGSKTVKGKEGWYASIKLPVYTVIDDALKPKKDNKGNNAFLEKNAKVDGKIVDLILKDGGTWLKTPDGKYFFSSIFTLEPKLSVGTAIDVGDKIKYQVKSGLGGNQGYLLNYKDGANNLPTIEYSKEFFLPKDYAYVDGDEAKLYKYKNKGDANNAPQQLSGTYIKIHNVLFPAGWLKKI